MCKACDDARLTTKAAGQASGPVGPADTASASYTPKRVVPVKAFDGKVYVGGNGDPLQQSYGSAYGGLTVREAVAMAYALDDAILTANRQCRAAARDAEAALSGR